MTRALEPPLLMGYHLPIPKVRQYRRFDRMNWRRLVMTRFGSPWYTKSRSILRGTARALLLLTILSGATSARAELLTRVRLC